jgi:PAS domain S-box-containing protein
LGAQPEHAPWRVLFLRGTALFSSSDMIYDLAMRDAITSGTDRVVEFHGEPLDAVRFTGTEFEQELMEFLRKKYRNMKFDLIVAAGPGALDFAARNRNALWPETPVVFYSVLAESLEGKRLPPDFTGLTLGLDPAGTIDLAMLLQPGARRIVVVAGKGAYDNNWIRRVKPLVERHRGRLDAEYLIDEPLPEILDRVSKLPADTIVLYLSMIRDAQNRIRVLPEVAKELAQASSAPVYGFFETYFGMGIIGGSIASFREEGVQAGRLALRILNGEKAESLPVQPAPPARCNIDWRQLKRWRIAETRVPAGCSVQYREPSFWEAYRRYIVATVLVVLVQATLILGLLVNRARRKGAERELRESEERYREVVDSQAELVCRYLPDTTLTFVNEAYCRFFGRRREELIGRQFLELIPEGDRAAALEHVASIGKEPRPVAYQQKVLMPDGSICWQEWVGHTIRLPRGVVELQGIGRDVTDRKRAEEANQRLTHLSRVAMLGELSGSLAHELNQPLSAILANAQAAQRFLAHNPANFDEIGDILQDIVRDDKRAGEVIRRLRVLFRKEEMQHQPVDVNEVVQEVMQLMRSELMNRQVSVVTRLAPELPLVKGDRVHLQQVLVNLVMNGCEAMTADSERGPRLSLQTRVVDANGVEVTLIDEGTGISPDQVERIFEPFVTTKAQGLGLGLSVCRTIIQAHGGRLWASNNADRGATFRFTLPAHTGGGSQ